MTITPDRLAKIKERCERASKSELVRWYGSIWQNTGYAEFGDVQQDLPDCLAEIDRLKGILARAMPCLDDRFKDLRNEIWEAIQ